MKNPIEGMYKKQAIYNHPTKGVIRRMRINKRTVDTAKDQWLVN